jgi:hypothetical protein
MFISVIINLKLLIKYAGVWKPVAKLCASCYLIRVGASFHLNTFRFLRTSRAADKIIGQEVSASHVQITVEARSCACYYTPISLHVTVMFKWMHFRHRELKLGNANQRQRTICSIPVVVAVGLCMSAGIGVPMKRRRHNCANCIAILAQVWSALSSDVSTFTSTVLQGKQEANKSNCILFCIIFTMNMLFTWAVRHPVTVMVNIKCQTSLSLALLFLLHFNIKRQTSLSLALSFLLHFNIKRQTSLSLALSFLLHFNIKSQTS